MKMDYFENRRSCRNFTNTSISDETLYDIVRKAMRAPTCGNMQLYSVIVTKDSENLSALANFHFNQPASTTAPVILTICADFNRFTRWCEINNADAGFDNFHSFITALTDAVIFAQQIVTVAEMEGYGSCYLGTVNYNAKEISEFLQLPDLVVPVAALSIGVAQNEGEKVERLEPEAVLHFEKYRKDGDDKIIELHKIKDEFEPNKAFVKENRKENIAQVISEIRYPRSMNEKVSESFLKLLKEKKFFN
ncbi:MAG: nitroreductase family protein [Muribaculaceae bacterium]|nr:nitroreductase family protein [Muribaculaceae bacterium]